MKYQLLINKHEKIVLKDSEDLKPFYQLFEYSNDVNDVYPNIDAYDINMMVLL